MTDELVEKVAIAIYQEDPDVDEREGILAWDDLNDFRKNISRVQARAALASLQPQKTPIGYAFPNEIAQIEESGYMPGRVVRDQWQDMVPLYTAPLPARNE